MSLADDFGRYPPGERPIDVPAFLGAGGGLSGSRLWRYRAPNGPRLLRAWPIGTGIDRVERVHGWLRATADLPFVARPIAAIDGSTAWESEDGSCREITAWLPGEAAVDSPTAARARAGLAGLAEFHRRMAGIEGRIGTSPGLAARRDEAAALIAGGFDLLAARLSHRGDDPDAKAATEWLVLARRLAPAAMARATAAARLDLELLPCLRDARAEHLLFAGDELAGLVDFGAMDVETPAADRARLLGEWLPRGLRDDLRVEALAAYGRVRPVSADETAAAEAFENLADVLIAERWVRWRFLEDRRFEDAGATTAGIARGLARIRRLADREFRPAPRDRSADPGYR